MGASGIDCPDGAFVRSTSAVPASDNVGALDGASALVGPSASGDAAVDVMAARPWVGKAIMLVDLDAFFASVEQLDHPAWRGKPVIVGGDPDKRGVVSTCSYEARKFGVHSAMASSMAKRLCPDAIWTGGHYTRYSEMSRMIMSIIHDETPFVQQVSIDEAFADVTPTSVNTEHPVLIARRIQRRVEELGVTCSIGLGTTKAIAKMASDMDKPRGLTVVYPGGERNFLDPLPVRLLSGIGAASEKTLRMHGIETLGDLARADEDVVKRILGKNGQVMQARARGREEEVEYESAAVKSVSNEVSFADYLTTSADLHAALASVAAKVGRRLRGKGLRGHTVALKIRYANRRVRSVQRQLPEPTDDDILLQPLLREMLSELWSEGVEVRLVGVAVSGFQQDAGPKQFSLFDDAGLTGDDADAGEGDAGDAANAAAASASADAMGAERRKKLLEATDIVRNRFGEGAVSYGRELRTSKNTTGTTAKNPSDYR